MAQKDARCINCGSLIHVDNKSDKSYCIFCDCVFETKEGLNALEHPEDYEFPNEEQPEYNGPLKQQQARVAPVTPVAPRSRKRKQDKPYEPKIKELPSLKIPKKNKIIIAVVVVAVIAIIAGILVPSTLSKNAQHKKISEQFELEMQAFNANKESINIQNLKSDYVVIVLDEAISEEEAVKIFNRYCAIRADVLDIKDKGFAATHSPVTMRIATTEGGWEIDQPESESDISSKALDKLP